MSWDAEVVGGHPGERFRVEVSSSGVDLVWYIPNPHAGYEGGTHLALEEFVDDAQAHRNIEKHCGDVACAEVLAEVRRLIAERAEAGRKA